MRFPAEVLKESVLEECDHEEYGIKFIEAGDWSDEGKYSYKEYIFEYQGKFYSVGDARSGSYFSYYNYESEHWDDEVDCDEVEKRAIIKYEWVPVNTTKSSSEPLSPASIEMEEDDIEPENEY